ncbi:CBS domain-containing protein (plasmid) [Deinococcus sp. KNUC1210]|uniref:CBS domain-containing protein n=1 Tax=Deinococcus sp. KNUC1210 TaxID=2917691 RepID=UPI001EEFF92C|nr:CBS domain-containing protein [Deinococcus sp. KNUC1210]ULH13849.1 CBS domain-containing protein [Deinococcus sp. KNUC1210]
MKIREYMSSEVVTVTPQTLLSEARRQLEASGLRCLPVVEGRTLVGLLLASDLPGETAPDTEVQALMRSPNVTVTPNGAIERAAILMLQHDVRGLPVVDDHEQLVGVLTVSDLLGVLVAHPPVRLWG